MVGDVLRALEGAVEIPVDDDRPLGAEARCLPMYGTRLLWREVNRRVVDLLDSLSVAELWPVPSGSNRSGASTCTTFN